MAECETKKHLIDPGLWAERRTERHGGPALFLDRDGVIVEEVNYLHKTADVQLTPDAGALIASVNRLGIVVVMVTNQAGVGRGYYNWRDFCNVQQEIHLRLAFSGAHIDAVYACGYHEKALSPLDVADHAWRKPNPGMLQAAIVDLGLDASRSWIVGDRASDLAAGRSAGLGGGALVSTGYGPQEIAGAEALAGAAFEVRRLPRLAGFDLTLF